MYGGPWGFNFTLIFSASSLEFPSLDCVDSFGLIIWYGATTIWCDNMSCIAILKNPVMNSRTKHIDIKYNFIRELITQGTIVVKHCNIDEHLTNIFTKPLTRQKHQMFRAQSGVCGLQYIKGDAGL